MSRYYCNCTSCLGKGNPVSKSTVYTHLRKFGAMPVAQGTEEALSRLDDAILALHHVRDTIRALYMPANPDSVHSPSFSPVAESHRA